MFMPALFFVEYDFITIGYAFLLLPGEIYFDSICKSKFVFILY